MLHKSENGLHLGYKINIMGLLTPKGKKDDKKNGTAKNNSQQSKFITKGNVKGTGGGFVKKGMTGGRKEEVRTL
jgi:hypothetical protein